MIFISENGQDGVFAGRNSLSSFVVTTDAAGTAYVNLANSLRLGQINLGILIQPIGTSVTPSFTLLNAKDEVAAAALAAWDAQSSVAANKIQSYFLVALWAKLVFAGAGSCVVAAM